MRESGYIEGRDVAIEHRFAYGQHDRLPSLARELVDLRVDVIVAADTPAIRAARDATSTIPIVMGVSGDPEASGFVESLARPGGNITGLSILAKDTSAKRLELLSELLPTANRIVVMMNPVNPVTASQLKEIQSAAHLRGVEIQAVHVVQPEEIDAAFAAVADAGIQALVVVGDPVFIGQPARVGELLTSYRLAAMVPPELIEDGGLIAYSPSIGDLLRRSAAYVTKILRGANAADLPVEQPTRFDLVLNLRTAQALGLTIPQSVLAQAVRMIS